MPAVSRNQQIAMAIAEHNPSKLYPRNRGLLNMSHQQLHDFAATPRTGLPTTVGTPKKSGWKKKKKNLLAPNAMSDAFLGR